VRGHAAEDDAENESCPRHYAHPHRRRGIALLRPIAPFFDWPLILVPTFVLLLLDPRLANILLETLK
jgi:hypothetical protein